MVSLSSKGSTFLGSFGLGRIKVVLSSIFFKKRLVKSHLRFSSFLPSTFSAKISDYSSEILASDWCKLWRSASFGSTHTSHSCGVHHILFPSNQIPVQLILYLRDKVWLVYRAFKHRSRGGCMFSKATDQY